jgi:hypothetical protein
VHQEKSRQIVATIRSRIRAKIWVDKNALIKNGFIKNGLIKNGLIKNGLSKNWVDKNWVDKNWVDKNCHNNLVEIEGRTVG